MIDSPRDFVTARLRGPETREGRALTELYLRRLKKYDPVLHCVITLTEERAMAQARAAHPEIDDHGLDALVAGVAPAEPLLPPHWSRTTSVVGAAEAATRVAT